MRGRKWKQGQVGTVCSGGRAGSRLVPSMFYKERKKIEKYIVLCLYIFIYSDYEH